MKREWLETDGLGGFAMGTADLIRTRRYHALLLVATTPPTGRVVLVNGLEAWVETAAGRFPISSQSYHPDVVAPDGSSRIESFEAEPWPRWTFRLENGTRVVHETFLSKKGGTTVLAWRLPDEEPEVSLSVRLLLSGRDSHALQRENPNFRFEPQLVGHTAIWSPYEGIPQIFVSGNGTYSHDPVWYRNFLYAEERDRGLDDCEDLASPGTFQFDLSRGEAVLLLSTQPPAPPEDSLSFARRLRGAEKRRRAAFSSRLEHAADAYIVRRGKGRTIIAGYPWFTDWGRDTFIALRGLCLARGRLETAREILLSWSEMVSEGMLPNRFPENGEALEYNSVDAPLWFIVAVHDYFAAGERIGRRIAVSERKSLIATVELILEHYCRGTRFGIRADGDGLLAAGVPGMQLTWMDAKVGDRVMTPRVGKPVEIQALWINALRIGERLSGRWKDLALQAMDSFGARFWNDAEECLFDVVDCDHVPGKTDASFRPNQIFAVGGLPVPLLEGERARRLVDAVESRLWTPMGLRSLARDDPAYAGRYEGNVERRDSAYHQGTVWPWLAGAFVEAWVRARGGAPLALREARERFLEPLLSHTAMAGLGHLPEIADGDSPHEPRGCPFQAWSVAEALRLDRVVLERRHVARPETIGAGHVIEP